MTDPAADLILRGDPRSAASWNERLRQDTRIAALNQTSEMKLITDALLRRSRENGAEGLALTGSTARAKRTRISDLDYHVVGPRPNVDDLPADVDVYAGDRDRLFAKLRAGDDFGQWTLRCGCILYDSGVFREAATEVIEHSLWPTGSVKLSRLPELRRLAERLIAVGDRDAAQEQVRATLTSTGRGVLLLRGVFPLARSELGSQLRGIGLIELATALDHSIYADFSLAELTTSLSLVDPFMERAVA